MPDGKFLKIEHYRLPSVSAVQRKSPRGDLPFGSSGGQERPTEAPCPMTATANAQAGLESIAGIAAKKKLPKLSSLIILSKFIFIPQ